MDAPSCIKIPHATAAAAEAHLRGLEARDRRLGRAPPRGARLHVYVCDVCNCYHVGHKSKRKEPTQ